MKRVAQLMKGIQAVFLVVMVVGVLSALLPLAGMAQETTPAAPAEAVWLTVLKAMLPVLASQVGPLLTKGLSVLMEGLPGWLRPVLSIVVGSVASAFAGVETGMPAEAAVAIGATGGATGHALMQSKPIPAPAA